MRRRGELSNPLMVENGGWVHDARDGGCIGTRAAAGQLLLVGFINEVLSFHLRAFFSLLLHLLVEHTSNALINSS